MRLVIGGAYQGKLDWVIRNYAIAQADIVDGENCSFSEIESAKGINHFHLYIRHFVEDGASLEEVWSKVQTILEKNSDLVIITDEIGLGIIPMEQLEREYREIHGRICCEIAKKAECIVRVYAGIGNRVK